jgi:simple sugar transport system permease protein
MIIRRRSLPRWIDIGVLPAVNVVIALIIAGLIVSAIGVSPLHAVRLLVIGAIGDPEAIGYTLYYATNFAFTGLAVALAIHAGLFNIGGEGQAYLGGLGAALVLLAFDASLPPILAVALAVIAAAAFGAAWAAIPAWLQASRGSHIVITTIMFNFIASALMVYLLVNVLIVPGSMSPESREFAASTRLPFIHELVGLTGVAIAPSPLNISVFLAIACCVLVWALLWRTSWGYELRALGHNAEAAVYAGVDRWRMTLVVMSLSGALAGLVGVNEIIGVHHRLILNFTAGYGFGGIAVALMGRNHPLGVVLSSLLFGALYQGGAELSFEIPAITREMVVVIQGLVILFSGALANLFRPAAERLVALWPRAAEPTTLRLGRP